MPEVGTFQDKIGACERCCEGAILRVPGVSRVATGHSERDRLGPDSVLSAFEEHGLGVPSRASTEAESAQSPRGCWVAT